MTFIAPQNSFVFDKNVQNLLHILNGKAKIVGGAVRNLILNIPVQDIDIATEYTPEVVINLCEKANIRTIPTGINHGTITAIIDKKHYEITTLRADVETFGRAAKVEFGTDWTVDAQRRDFTMNALYLNADGTLYDPLNGFEDVLNKRIKFIGDINARICEDYLRILRYFRFCTQLNTQTDTQTLYIIAQNINGLQKLSAERVWSELHKILSLPNATHALPAMAEIGIFQTLGFGVPFGITLKNTMELSGLEKLFFHFIWLEEDANRISKQLKLSNMQSDTLFLWSQHVWHIRNRPHLQEARKLLYSVNDVHYSTILKIAAQRWGWSLTFEILDVPNTHSIPEKPFTAQQFIEKGLSGKQLGEALRMAELIWKENNFN